MTQIDLVQRLNSAEPGWTINADVIVIGSGIAGLTSALSARAKGLSVLLLTKDVLSTGSTSWAQGGIAAALGPGDSPDQHFQDTLEAGAGLCDSDAVKILVQEGPAAVRRLINLGATFDLDSSGNVALTREGGHRRDRIAHAGGDATGAEISRALVAKVLADPKVKIFEHALVLDLLKDKNERVCGVTLHVMGKGKIDGVGAALARAVVLATGGLGAVFQQTTNPLVATGDGVALALRAGATVSDLEFVQFHPTVLWRDLANRGQQPLISEAVRGEGAVLLNNKNEQFMIGKHPQADLAPRDIVAIEIFNQMQISGQPYVWLDATKISDFPNRFPTIYASCLENGIDPTKEKIPVAPASHYASGGVLVDLNGKSSVDGLYICGESACTGAHGANRLASNSLLEGLVFGARIAANLSKDLPAQQQPVEDNQSILLDPKILLPLQIAMSEGAGVLRSKASLTKTLQTLNELSKLTSKEPRIEAWEATNLHLLATVIVKSALMRTESRGSHRRSDYPETDEKWLSRIVQEIDLNGNWQNKVEAV